MNVNAILKQKSRAVTTAPGTMTLMEATHKLATKRIGAIVVVDRDNRVAGIVSERDIIRAIAQSGAGALERPISDVMTRVVITCTAADTLDHLMQEMTRGRFRHVPVLDSDRKLDGIVSIGDVVKYHVEEIEMEAHAMREYIAHT